PDADRVDRGDEDLHLREVAERDPPGAARAVDRDARLPWEQADAPGPDVLAVDEDEEDREERDEGAREELPRSRTDGERPADPDRAVALDALPELVGPVENLRLGDVERRRE